MRFSPLLLFAQTAAAFLVPPGTSDTDLKAFDLEAALALPRIVRVPCDGCPFKEEGVKTDLVFDFTIPDGPHHTMKINRVPIFPLEESDPTIPLTAVQMPHDVDTTVYMVDRAIFPTVKLDHARMVTTDEIRADGSQSYTLELSIIAVSGKRVKLQGILISVYKNARGELSFGNVRAVPKSQNCGTSLKCLVNKMKLRLSKMKTPWGKFKGCGGGASKARIGAYHKHRPHHHPHRPHSHGSHSHPRPHYHHRGMFLRIVAQVLVPIMVGILAGMTVSLAGLVIAHGVISMYRRFSGIKAERRCGGDGRGFFCRRRRLRLERTRQQLAASEADGEVEKGLLQEEDQKEPRASVSSECPPAYIEEGIEAVEKE